MSSTPLAPCWAFLRAASWIAATRRGGEVFGGLVDRTSEADRRPDVAVALGLVEDLRARHRQPAQRRTGDPHLNRAVHLFLADREAAFQPQEALAFHEQVGDGQIVALPIEVGPGLLQRGLAVAFGGREGGEFVEHRQGRELAVAHFKVAGGAAVGAVAAAGEMDVAARRAVEARAPVPGQEGADRHLLEVGLEVEQTVAVETLLARKVNLAAAFQLAVGARQEDLVRRGTERESVQPDRREMGLGELAFRAVDLPGMEPVAERVGGEADAGDLARRVGLVDVPGEGKVVDLDRAEFDLVRQQAREEAGGGRRAVGVVGRGRVLLRQGRGLRRGRMPGGEHDGDALHVHRVDPPGVAPERAEVEAGADLFGGEAGERAVGVADGIEPIAVDLRTLPLEGAELAVGVKGGGGLPGHRAPEGFAAEIGVDPPAGAEEARDEQQEQRERDRHQPPAEAGGRGGTARAGGGGTGRRGGHAVV